MINWKLVRHIDKCVGIPLAYTIALIRRPFSRFDRLTKDTEYKRILLVKFWGIGNIIMLLPSAQALKEKYPEAEVDLLTLSSNKGVAEFSSMFDHFYYIDTGNFLRFFKDTFKLVRQLIKRNYDVIIDFEQFARYSALFCALIGKKKTIGFSTTGQHKHFLFTHPVNYNNNIHITQSFFDLVKCAGVSPTENIKPVPLNCRETDIKQINRILSGTNAPPGEILISMHVATSQNFGLRRWPSEYFAALADKLIEHFGVKIVIMAAPDEVALGVKTFSLIKNQAMTINTSGKLNFRQFITLIKQSDLVISADTAPVHVASSLNVPVAGLYGPNTPFLYGPWGKNSIWFYKDFVCSPCITNYNAKLNKCRHPEGQGTCMRKISVDQVFAGIKKNYFDEDAPYKLEKAEQYE